MAISPLRLAQRPDEIERHETGRHDAGIRSRRREPRRLRSTDETTPVRPVENRKPQPFDGVMNV